MPLAPGNDSATISRNIHELTHFGSQPRSHAQIVAIALSNADRHPHRATGGGIGHVESYHLMPALPAIPKPQAPMSPSQGTPYWTRSAARQIEAPPRGGGGIGRQHFAIGGGMMSAATAMPWTERQDAQQIYDVPHNGGLINSSTAGRTDRLPLSVPDGSHVIPADVMSSLNQGNTIGSDRILKMALGTWNTGPYGIAPPKMVRGHGPPSAPHQQLPGGEQPELATGGHARRTPILAAGGEGVVAPWEVELIGQRGMAGNFCKAGESVRECGHRLLDKMIKKVRADTIEWMKSAPPPKK